MKSFSFKQALPYLVAIVIFVVLSLVYMAPAAFEHKDLPQGDVTNARGFGKDLNEYHAKTGEYAYWTNGMFSGMPANFTFAPQPVNIFRSIGKIVRLNLPHYHIGLIFLYLIGFYILLLAFGCNPWLSLIGAIAYTFASYNIIIIEAGHVNKALVMATMAPILGGIILCYKQKYLIGSLITLIFAGLNVYWAHQQISYYLLIIIIVLAITYFIYAAKEKKIKRYLVSSALLIVVAGISILPSLGSLLPTADYTKETMRGGSVLTQNAENKKESAGLDIDYAYSWSYGVEETLTLLIPNLYGGSSHYNIGNESACYKALRTSGQAKQFCQAAPTYWGDQPFTSGPVYAGAIICFLFILGLFVVKGPERWWLLIATIIAIVLSWGKNFMGLNEFLFHHLPLYNKFRTPSMSLVIANVTMATLGILAIKEIMADGDKKKFLKPLYISFGITGGLCLIFALFGKSMFEFSSNIDANYPAWLVTALKADRADMLSSDAWRSFAFILVAFGLMWLYVRKGFKVNYLIFGIGILILLDLWTVDKRFLNDDDFVSKKVAKTFTPTKADLQILQDKDPDYRVLNLTVNTFNDASTSYFHKSVGGYNAAKLRRYQDIIDYHFSKGLNMSVLNMLNTRYFIVPNQNGGQMVQQNPNAMGNAWFVDEIEWVESPDEEIAALYDFDPAKTAYIDKVWQEKLPNTNALQGNANDNAQIVLSDYVNPGYLVYQSQNEKAQLAVFSEVFYKTWKAYIDGKETPIVRANYILRALPIPAGNHQIEFKCVDEVYVKSGKISLWSSILVGVIIVGLLGGMAWNIFGKGNICKKKAVA